MAAISCSARASYSTVRLVPRDRFLGLHRCSSGYPVSQVPLVELGLGVHQKTSDRSQARKLQVTGATPGFCAVQVELGNSLDERPKYAHSRQFAISIFCSANHSRPISASGVHKAQNFPRHIMRIRPAPAQHSLAPAGMYVSTQAFYLALRSSSPIR